MKKRAVSILSIIVLSLTLLSSFLPKPFTEKKNSVLDSQNEEFLIQNESPSSQEEQIYNYGHLNLRYPFYEFIFAPTYLERYQDQPESTIYYYIPWVDYRENIDWYTIEIDGEEKERQELNEWGQEERIDYTIPPTIMNNVSEHVIKFSIKKENSKQTFTHEMILNITEVNPSLSMNYDDFYFFDNNSPDLEWKVYTAETNDSTAYKEYNYTIYVDDEQEVEGTNKDRESSIIFQYTPYLLGDPYQNRSIRLEIVDEEGFTTKNEFLITKGTQTDPYISEFYIEGEFDPPFTCYEDQNVYLTVTATDPDNSAVLDDIDKIYIFISQVEYPLQIIENVESNVVYDIPLTTVALKEIEEKQNFEIGHLKLSAVVVDRGGRFHGRDLHLGNLLRNDFILADEQIQEMVRPGKYISSLNPKHQYLDVEYKVTTYVSVIEETKFSFATATADTWEDYLEQTGNSQKYNRVTDGWRSDVFQEGNLEGGWTRGIGVVFWINAGNTSAVDFPITVKLTYPEEIAPDEILEEPSLQFMHWKSDYEKYSEIHQWHVYANESVTDSDGMTRDERYKEAGDYTYEFQIYEFGLYAFGMDAEVYRLWDEAIKNMDIPGYFSFHLVAMLSIVSIYLVRKSKQTRA